MNRDDALAGFPVVIDQDVRWGDLDAYGHVNNTVFFRFFESARIAYFEAIGFVSAGSGIGPILHSTNCRFRLPLGYPDQLKVGARVTDLQKDRFTMEYKIASAKHRAVAGEGTGLIVAYDYGRQAKAELPAEVVSKIQAVEKGRDVGISSLQP
jgi:acyl-CoA thioester hydrolase